MRLLRDIGRFVAICWHYGLQRQKVEMSYRGDFLINLFINVFHSVIQLFFIWALFYRVPEIAGWRFEEVVLIYGFGQLGFGYFRIFFFEMVVRFADFYIIEGNLDRPLVRPLSPLLQVVMENINLREFTVILKGTAIVWWALENVEPRIGMSVANFFTAQALAIMGALVYAGVFIGAASISFWVKDRVGFASPLFSISEASRYPLTIYHPAVRVFFSLVIPFGFAAFYPAVYFVDPHRWLGWLAVGPLVAIATFSAGMGLFKLGVHRYESTGS